MSLDQLSSAGRAFISHYEDPTHVPMHHFLLLLQVDLLESPTYGQLESALGISNSSVSRTINALGEEHRNGKPGLGFLATYKDPEDRRRLIVTLTPKGSAFLRHLQAIRSRPTLHSH